MWFYFSITGPQKLSASVTATVTYTRTITPRTPTGFSQNSLFKRNSQLHFARLGTTYKPLLCATSDAAKLALLVLLGLSYLDDLSVCFLCPSHCFKSNGSCGRSKNTTCNRREHDARSVLVILLFLCQEMLTSLDDEVAFPQMFLNLIVLCALILELNITRRL